MSTTARTSTVEAGPEATDTSRRIVHPSLLCQAA